MLMRRKYERDFTETGREYVVWIHLGQDRDQYHTFVNIIMNLQVPLRVAKFLNS
jgi:hypothetical protein